MRERSLENRCISFFGARPSCAFPTAATTGAQNPPQTRGDLSAVLCCRHLVAFRRALAPPPARAQCRHLRRSLYLTRHVERGLVTCYPLRVSTRNFSFPPSVADVCYDRPLAMDQQISRDLAAQTGISFDLVHFLRTEFKKFGRNPLDSSIEILAIENGLDEEAVKALYHMHAEYMRKMDGLADQKRGMF